MKIVLSSDHAGYEMKKVIVDYLESKGHTILDVGCDNEERCDYPDFAHKGTEKIVKDNCVGIFVCGSGNGINISANKRKGIRSALCWNEEIATLAKAHNNANVMCLPGRFIDENTARACVAAFLETEFEGGRHLDRINKIEE